MKSHSQDPKELRKDIYRLRRDLRDDIKQVREVAKISPLVPRTALQKMTKIERSMREKAVKYMSQSELLSLYRQLEYVRNLKSSYLRGALETAEKFEPIRRNLESLSEDQRREWWRVYGELYKHTPTMEHFKYEIFALVDTAFGGMETDEIIRDIIDEYNSILEGDNGKRSEAQVAILLTEKLQDLLKKIGRYPK